MSIECQAGCVSILDWDLVTLKTWECDCTVPEGIYSSTLSLAFLRAVILSVICYMTDGLAGIKCPCCRTSSRTSSPKDVKVSRWTNIDLESIFITAVCKNPEVEISENHA